MPRERSRTLGGGMNPGLDAVVETHERRLLDLEQRERGLKEEIHKMRLDNADAMNKLTSAVEECRKPLKTISWVSRTVGAALIGLLVVAVWKMFSFQLPAAPLPPSNPAYRMGSDHVAPDPTEGHHQP